MTGRELPVHCAVYREKPREREFEASEIDTLLEKKVIELFETEWTTPLVFMAREDCSPRFCVYYQRLNVVAERDLYFMPEWMSASPHLEEYEYSLLLDANGGYLQVEIEDADRHRTAFT